MDRIRVDSQEHRDKRIGAVRVWCEWGRSGSWSRASVESRRLVGTPCFAAQDQRPTKPTRENRLCCEISTPPGRVSYPMPSCYSEAFEDA